MGVIWLIFAATNLIDWVARWTLQPVIWGIQVTLGVLLAVEALTMIGGNWVLGIAAFALVLVMRQNRHAPAALVLMMLGIGISLVTGALQHVSPPGFSLPPLTTFTPQEVWRSLLLAGFA